MTKIISILLVTIVLLLSACGGESSKKGPSSLKSISDAEATEPAASPTGIGEIKSVTLTDPLDESMVASGKAIYDMKCSACHKLTGQRVVGPGWSGVPNRRRPE